MYNKTLLALPWIAGTLTRGLARFARILVHVLSPLSGKLYCKEANLGLTQHIKLQDKVTKEQASLFLDDLCSELQFEKRTEKWIVRSMQGKRMIFEIVVTDCGFYTHRSGDYFEFLGFLIEQLTEKFGTIWIEDV